MFRFKTISWCVLCALSAAGCANWSERNSVPLRVEPSVGMGHASASSAYQAGRYHHGQLSYERAMAAYREALELDPSHADARNGMAIIYSMQGRHEEAIRQLEAAVAVAPHAAYLRSNLGYVYMLRGKLPEAVKQFEEAKRIEPSNKKALENLQLAHARMAAAMTSAESSIQSPPQTPPPAAGAGQETPGPSAQTTKGSSEGSRIVPVTSQIYEMRPEVQPVAPPAAPASFPLQRERLAPPVEPETAFIQPSMNLPSQAVAASAAPLQAVEAPAGAPTGATMSTKEFIAMIKQAAYGPTVPMRLPAGAANAQVKQAPKAAAATAPIRQASAMPALSKAAAAHTTAYRLEISNGNGLNGFAKRVAQRLADFGIKTARLTNQKPFEQPATEVQYRDGYAAEAERLARQLKVNAATVRSDRLNPGIHVRLVLGKDAWTEAALIRPTMPVQAMNLAAVKPGG